MPGFKRVGKTFIAVVLSGAVKRVYLDRAARNCQGHYQCRYNAHLHQDALTLRLDRSPVNVFECCILTKQ